MNILCPTDFSDHAKLALDYAVNLCNQLDARLHVLNTYSVKRNAASMIDLHDTIRQNTEEDMAELIGEISADNKTGTAITSTVIMGKASDVIKSYSENNNIDLIVMGTQGSNSLKTLLFGSTTARLSQISAIPILAIPNEIAERSLSSKILLALDNQGVSHADVLKLPKQIAENNGIYIDILHVTDGVSTIDPELIVSYLGSLTGETTVIDGNDGPSAIKHYAESNDVGLIVMVRRDKTFLQRLLSKGYTEQEVLQTFTPLMILPDTKVD